VHSVWQVGVSASLETRRAIDLLFEGRVCHPDIGTQGRRVALSAQSVLPHLPRWCNADFYYGNPKPWCGHVTSDNHQSKLERYERGEPGLVFWVESQVGDVPQPPILPPGLPAHMPAQAHAATPPAAVQSGGSGRSSQTPVPGQFSPFAPAFSAPSVADSVASLPSGQSGGSGAAEQPLQFAPAAGHAATGQSRGHAGESQGPESTPVAALPPPYFSFGPPAVELPELSHLRWQSYS
jgi:hypothetical protein